MEYSKLPKVRLDKHMDFPYFPDRFYAAVFRLWEMCGSKRIANALSVPCEVVEKAAEDMGLSAPQCTDIWMERGYISIIRTAWHILPYAQLLKLLNWSEEKLAFILKEDDFLDIKLGKFKPYCEEIVYQKLTESGKKCLEKIRKTMEINFKGTTEVQPFQFLKEFKNTNTNNIPTSENLRMIYSYCGLYAGVLDNDISKSFPESLLENYKNSGINALWIPVVLYQLVPFPFDESRSEGWENRQRRLRELIELLGKYDIKLYLYLNEPRCMPLEFFEDNPELLGSVQNETYGALCTSVPQVMDYLRYAVREVCRNAPALGGFFTITCAEYLTHCKSRDGISRCSRCADIPVYQLVSDVVRAIYEESSKIDRNIRTIAWTWAWEEFMSFDDMLKCIDLIPKGVIIQCNSEAKKEYVIGGVKGQVSDYSISVPGPGEMAKRIWDYALKKGHEVCAKVQVNVTWECSTLPFLPVFDLIREHMKGLKESGVEHMMLSWTLGGCPSVNLKIASGCLNDNSEEKYIKLLEDEYGEYAVKVKKAATLFSDAFRKFPFNIWSVYYGPQNPGPSNLLYLKPSGFDATMTCYAYDDIDSWRADYSREVYINQLRKMAFGWEKGLEEIKDIPDCEFKQVSYAAYAILRSSYNQAEFINLRDNNCIEKLSEIAASEKQMAVLLYEIMQKNSFVGYEAANHYYYTKSMLAEKVLNCEYIFGLLN